MKNEGIDIDHIDPRWEEGRDYQLVCGFERDPKNLREEYSWRNGSKSNRFLPWRWNREELGVVPEEPGDLALFLDPDTNEWVLEEFMGEWWFEKTKKLCGPHRAGNTNVKSGHIQRLGRIQGPFNVESGHLDRIRQLIDPVKQIERIRKQGLKNATNGHLDRIRELIDKEAAAERARELGKRTGPISGKRNAESGHCKRIAYLGGLATGKMAAEKLNTTKWLCMVTGKISTKGPLTMYQKSLGIDPRLKVRVSDLLPQQLPIILAGI